MLSFRQFVKSRWYYVFIYFAVKLQAPTQMPIIEMFFDFIITNSIIFGLSYSWYRFKNKPVKEQN